MKAKSYLVKTDEEIAKIKIACDISSQLHTLAMKETLTSISELSLAKKIIQHKENIAATKWAYPLIIGSGQRATQLHAKPSSKIIKDTDLVLVDMGVKFQEFCSDITRTWPAGNKFSPEQREIYQIVLSTQKEVITKIKPNETLDNLHTFCKEILSEKLLSKNIIKKQLLNDVYPHKTSHWIGRKVHDKCPYHYEDNSPIQLSAGMIFTIEPGLYFKKWGLKYDGIGVRIEDVVLVTNKGCEVLTNPPKELEEIEMIKSRIGLKI